MTLKIEKLNEKLLCVAAVAKATAGWTERDPALQVSSQWDIWYMYVCVADMYVCVHVKVCDARRRVIKLICQICIK